MREVPFTRLQGIFDPQTDMTPTTPMKSPMDAGPLTIVQLVILLQNRIIYNIFPDTSTENMSQIVRYHKKLNIHVSLDKPLQ
jgi:hypothetical protein